MKIYRGWRDEKPGPARVMVRELGHPETSYPLDPRHDVRSHSPDGFQWGFSGSGPAQLALALLCDALGDVEAARQHYQAFKRECLSGLHADTWTFSDGEIRTWVEQRREAKP